MPRCIRSTLVAFAVLAVAAPAAVQAEKPRRSNHRVEATIKGALVEAPATSAFTFTDPLFGAGAGSLTLDGTQGKAVVYLVRGSLKATLKVTLKPVRDTEVAVSAVGTITSGTGRYKGATGSIGLFGPQDSSTSRFEGHLSGVIRY